MGQLEIKKQIEDNNYKWYTISVVSGQEDLVIQNLKERISKQNLSEDIIDYMLPKVPEVRYNKWKKVVKERKLYPGYIFVKSKMNEKIWYIIRNTPWVRLIVGAEVTPIPLTDSEYEDIQRQIKEKTERAEHASFFKEWDVVKIKDWEFKDIKWKVVEVDTVKGFLSINVDILWRTTPLMLPFEKVELDN